MSLTETANPASERAVFNAGLLGLLASILVGSAVVLGEENDLEHSGPNMLGALLRKRDSS